MHYLFSWAGQGSPHVTDGVNTSNASLMCSQPIKKFIYLCSVSFSYCESNSTLLRNVEVWRSKTGNGQGKAATSTVSRCLPAPLTELSRLMSAGAVRLLGLGRGHCPGFHFFNSCRLPAEPTWYSVLSLTLSLWNWQTSMRQQSFRIWDVKEWKQGSTYSITVCWSVAKNVLQRICHLIQDDSKSSFMTSLLKPAATSLLFQHTFLSGLAEEWAEGGAAHVHM